MSTNHRVRLGLVTIASTLLLLAACGSGIAASTVPSQDFKKYRRSYWVRQEAPAPDILYEPPREPFAVVGWIEVRTSRPKSMDALSDALIEQAMELEADAVIPAHGRASSPGQDGSNPFRRYYTMDDGRVQVLSAQAVRFQRAPR
jgi:hypothetical protein